MHSSVNGWLHVPPPALQSVSNTGEGAERYAGIPCWPSHSIDVVPFLIMPGAPHWRAAGEPAGLGNGEATTVRATGDGAAVAPPLIASATVVQGAASLIGQKCVALVSAKTVEA